MRVDGRGRGVKIAQHCIRIVTFVTPEGGPREIDNDGAVKGGEGEGGGGGVGRTMKFGQLGSRGEGQQDYFELLSAAGPLNLELGTPNFCS